MKKILFGIFAGIGLFFVSLIVLAIIAASWGSKSLNQQKQHAQLPEKIVLTLNLDQGLHEQVAADDLLSLIQTGGQHPPSLTQIVQTLDQARLDQNVQGLVVMLQEGDFGPAGVQELRAALGRFRRSGKFAYLYAETLGTAPAMSEYWLATAFDQIWLQPLGDLAITGFAAEMPFGRALLDKVGVQPEMLHQGKYKSFPESVMRNNASPENTAMTNDMLHNLNAQFVTDVSQTRQLRAQKIAELMAASPFSAATALKEGLIDAIGYRDEFDSYLEQTTKGGSPVALEDYLANGPRAVPGEKVALITIEGVLVSNASESGLGDTIAPADEIVQTIEEAVDAKQFKAIILRVNSPGGTPLAADAVRRAIELAKQRKPVVVSMSDAAASGGYWMSVAANKIVAQPATITGSIGVFGGKFNVASLWQKLGVTWQAFPNDGQSPTQADLWSINRPYSSASAAKMTDMMARTYAQFIDHVARGRKMSRSKVESLAQGRVWTGEQAFENGLVDGLGGVDVASNMVRELAQIPEMRAINVEAFPKELTPLEQIMHMFGKTPRSQASIAQNTLHRIQQGLARLIVASLRLQTLYTAPAVTN